MSEYLLCLILFCIGLYCILRKRNIIKIIIGLGIVEYAVNLFLILVAYRSHARAPILAQDQIISKIAPSAIIARPEHK